MTVPADARVTEPYWHREGEAGRYTFDADAPFGLPFRPTPFYAQVTLRDRRRRRSIVELPVQYRYEGNIFSGEKRIGAAGRAGVVGARARRRSRSFRAAAPGPQRTAAPSGSAARGARRSRVRRRRNNAPAARRDGATCRSTCRRAGRVDAGRGDVCSFARADESQTVRFKREAAGRASAPGEYPRRRRVGSTSGGADVRPRLPGDRVPAHPAAAHLRRRRRHAEGHRRAACRRTLRSATSWASATRCRRRSSSSGRTCEHADAERSRVGRPLALRRHRHRRARLRAARRICARTTAGCSTTSRAAAR